jgi:tetratricopeptide (TPR) repeat protein
MRDDFASGVKTTLARRVGYFCSNPDCRAVTIGPGSEPDATVNLGVAAHITAAAPGGPRFDESLTPAERSEAANGIWLCQTCAKLVDSDEPAYSVEILRGWKSDAEEHAGRLLGVTQGTVDEPLHLALPAVDDDEFLLSYTNTALDLVGRDQELAELVAFLEDDRPFCWWLWTGAAGMGKSRLALELCRAQSTSWHAGFLREANQDQLLTVRPLAPTLVVVDYAAQRSGWLSDALFAHAERHRGAKLRVLVLEREAAGPWWSKAQREDRLSEASSVAASMYDLPAELRGLSRERLLALIDAVAKRLGVLPTSTEIEEIADHAESMDPAGRPLFAFVATIDWLSDTISVDRDQALRRLISRADASLQDHIGETAATFRARNVRLLGTLVGGMSIESYSSMLERSDLSPPSGLLPAIYDDVHPVGLDELLAGIVPDILGELAILDRFAAAGVEVHAARSLRDLAWRWSAEAYSAFVQRAAADHREHPRLMELLDVAGAERDSSWVRLLIDVIPMLRRSDHPLLTWILDHLEAAGTRVTEPADEDVATARFRFATLVFHEGDTQRANALYSDLVDATGPAWRVHMSARNNRGITWTMLDRNDLAREDYTAVIESDTAPSETRAMSYNNRADTYDAEGNASAAIADRTAVLELADTSFDRRYIARIRRARVLRAIGDHAGADADIDAILATADIAMEQKMAARLERAQWLIDDGAIGQATLDLETIVASRRNFDAIDADARALLVQISGDEQQGDDRT